MSHDDVIGRHVDFMAAFLDIWKIQNLLKIN